MRMRVVAEALGFTEGPLWIPGGTLAIASNTHGAIYFIVDETTSRLDIGGGPTGLALAADGSVYVAANGGFWGAAPTAPAGIRRVRDGRVENVITKQVRAPNDVCFGDRGYLYFTDPISETGLEQPVPGRIFAYEFETSTLTSIAGPLFPNGLALAPDGDVLYVNETFSRRVLAVQLEHGRLGDHDVLFELEGTGADGMALDRAGNLWLCLPAADVVASFTPAGRPLERFELDEGSLPTNCCFGGEQLDTLFVTASGREAVLALDVGVRGLPLRGG